MRWAYQRLKTNREQHLAKHVGSICAYVQKAKKLGKVIMKKVATSRKKIRLIIDSARQDPFQFVSV